MKSKHADTVIVNKTANVGMSEPVEEQRPDGIVGPLEEEFCQVCGVSGCEDHGDVCKDCGGSGYGPDQMNGNEVFQDKCSTCDGEGRILDVPVYRVIVGNVGTVHDSLDRQAAENCYFEYVTRSSTGYGRVAGEPVSLLQDGEPIKEYSGTIERD